MTHARADLSRLLDPERLAALRSAALMDSPPLEAFDRLTRLATRVLGVPVSVVAFVDEAREFWMSHAGAAQWGAEAPHVPLERSLGKYVVAAAGPLVVDDAREHPLLRENSAVTEGGVAAYAGVPLVTPEGHVLGSFCVIGFEARRWSEHDLTVLQDLAAAVMAEVEVRTAAALADRERAERTALLDSALDGIYGMDREGVCTFINRMGAEMLGYSRHELLGRNMHEVIHHTRLDGSPYPAAECPIMVACVQGTHCRTDDDVFWRRDGTPVRVEYACASLVRDGELVGGVITFRDITERWLAEENRRASERRAERMASRMRAVAEAASGVIGAHTLVELNSVLHGAAGRVLPHDVFTFGTYDPAEHTIQYAGGWDGEVWEACGSVPLAGKPSEKVVRERISLLTHRADDAGSAGAVHFGTSRRSESAIRTPIVLGERVLGVLSVQSYTQDLYTPEDVLVLEAFAAVAAGALHNVEMLEERERVSAAVRASEERYRALVENATEAIVTIDVDSRIIAANPAAEQIFGYSAPELGSVRFTDLIPERFREAHQAAIRRYMQSNQRRIPWTGVELPGLHKDGREIRLDITFSEYARDGNRFFTGVMRDITLRKEAEERATATLRESEERYRSMFEGAAEGMFLLVRNGDGSFRYVDANPALERIGGLAREDFVGRGPRDLLPADVAARLTALYSDVFETGEPAEIEHTNQMPRGRISTRTRYYPLRGAAGQVVQILGITEDTTERKRAEQALQESEERYRSLFEEVPVGLYRTTPDGRFLDVNPALVHLLGYPDRETLLRASAPSFYVDPADRMRWQAELQRTAVVKDFEVQLRQRDGTSIWVRHTARAKRNPDGDVLHYDGVVEDITRRREAEVVLRQRDARFRSLMRNALDMVLVLDRAGTVQYASRSVERVLGYRRDELGGRNVLELVHPEDFAAARGAIEAGVRSPGTPQSVQVRVRHQDGTWRVQEAVGTSLLDDPAVQGFVINTRDITERKALEDQLRQAVKMEAVGRLAGGVAHDFNNLLTAISGNTELLLADTPEGSPARDDLKEIQRAADRAAELTRQLLAFSRKQVIKPRELYLDAVVSGMERMLGRLLGDDIELIVTSDEGGVGPVLADSTQIEQVVLNLAVNARDAMPHGGVLRIHTVNVQLTEADRGSHGDVAPGEYVLLKVGDTGHGMSPDVLELIFEPFYTTKEEGKGTGLGLSTVYGIVKQAGGYIWAESSPGAGTRFYIYIPRLTDVADGTGEAESAGAAPASRATQESRGTVLVVEDQDPVRRVAVKVLRRAGFTVREARTGAEALRLLAEGGAADLLLTDVVMPGMSGRELAEELRRLYPGTPTLFMSGYTEDEVVRRGIGEEAVEFIPKPFSPAELVRRVLEVMSDGPN